MAPSSAVIASSRRRPERRLRRFLVLGERCSGTNFLHAICKRNLHLVPDRTFGCWKHGFTTLTAIPDDLLILVAVRNPFDWARSLHSRPWHAVPELQALEFPEFLRAVWRSQVDRVDPFGFRAGQGLERQPLQLDRHPINGKAFENIFQMRACKNAAWTGLLHRECNVALVRCEDMVADTQSFLEQLAETFEIARKNSFRGIERRLGQRFRAAVPERPQTPDEYTADDRSFVLSQISREQESFLGYEY